MDGRHKRSGSAGTHALALLLGVAVSAVAGVATARSGSDRVGEAIGFTHGIATWTAPRLQLAVSPDLELRHRSVVRQIAPEVPSHADARSPTRLLRKRTASRRATTGAVEVTAAPTSDLERELALLKPAETALRKGRAKLALRLFERHARLFPKSSLAEEAAAGRVLALCKLSDSRAPNEVRSFERRHPRSPLRRRLERSCGQSATR